MKKHNEGEKERGIEREKHREGETEIGMTE